MLDRPIWILFFCSNIFDILYHSKGMQLSLSSSSWGTECKYIRCPFLIIFYYRFWVANLILLLKSDCISYIISFYPSKITKQISYLGTIIIIIKIMLHKTVDDIDGQSISTKIPQSKAASFLSSSKRQMYRSKAS